MAIPAPITKPTVPKPLPKKKPPVTMDPATMGGGRAQPKKKPGRRAGGTTIAAPPPESDAMGLFRTTLAQIRSLQTPVNTAAISAPYDSASVAAGQLGTGLAAAQQASGQAAQSQYAKARDEAQQHAASFGVAVHAPPPGVEDTGSALLAQQTQAQTAAANQAGAAWANLLNQMKTGAISRATIAHDQRAQDQEVALAGQIPSWEQANKTLDFQKSAASMQNDYLLSTLTQKERDALRRDQTNRFGITTTANTAATAETGRNTRAAASLADRLRHDTATIQGAMKRAQLLKTNRGTQGLDKALSIMRQGKAGTTKTQTGWTVMVQPEIPGQPGVGYGTAQPWPTANTSPGWHPTGYVRVQGQQPQPVYKTTPVAAKGLSLQSWNAMVTVVKQSNPGMSVAEAQNIVQHLTPRPPK